jgi:hypothetical protein
MLAMTIAMMKWKAMRKFSRFLNRGKASRLQPPANNRFLAMPHHANERGGVIATAHKVEVKQAGCAGRTVVISPRP